jgi:hypothetical protein
MADLHNDYKALAEALKAENANLRAEVERMTKMGPGHTCWATMDTAQKEALIEQRDRALLQVNNGAECLRLAISEREALKLQMDELVGWLQEIHREATIHDLNSSLPSTIRSMAGRVAKYVDKPSCVHSNTSPFGPGEKGLLCEDCGVVVPASSEKTKQECTQCHVVNGIHEAGCCFEKRKCPVCGGDHVEPCAFV